MAGTRQVGRGGKPAQAVQLKVLQTGILPMPTDLRQSSSLSTRTVSPHFTVPIKTLIGTQAFIKHLHFAQKKGSQE